MVGQTLIAGFISSIASMYTLAAHMNEDPASTQVNELRDQSHSTSGGSTARPSAEFIPQSTPTYDKKQFATSMEQFEKFLAQPEVSEAIVSITHRVIGFLAPFKPVFEAIGSMVLLMSDVLSRLPDYMLETVLSLANRGWFFDPEMKFLEMSKAKTLIASGDLKGADAFMANHFEAKLDSIEEKLISVLPHRARFFRSGFAAHRRGEFDLSILSFISQADGVCNELRGGHFFLMDRVTRRPESASYADAVERHVYDQIAHVALKAKLSIKEQMSKRSLAGANALNRHAVMHGGSLDHDTREGSLQALSLLNYVAIALDSSEGSPLSQAKSTPLGSLLEGAMHAKKYSGDKKD